MLVISQDRDVSVKFIFGKSQLTALPVFNNGICFGFNLCLDDVMIGTFDTLRQVQMEITNILSCPHNVYMVSGCGFMWEDWETYKEIMCS